MTEYWLKNSALENNEKNEIGKCINLIKQNCYRFTKIINNIVDISKIDSGFYNLYLRNENIVDVVENVVQLVAADINGNGLHIVFDTDIEERIIACDPEKIERILLNLISNAIKFSNIGSEIVVNIADKVEFVEVSVTDTGAGIDDTYLDSIFERFKQVDKTLTRNAEGSGIGLSLVKSIVELHSGKISVESELGKGSIFKIELPARIVEQPIATEQTMQINDKVEMINIEFSDIYHL